jgi:hypothetical protein
MHPTPIKCPDTEFLRASALSPPRIAGTVLDGGLLYSHKRRLSAGYEGAADRARLLDDKKTELPK